MEDEIREHIQFVLRRYHAECEYAQRVARQHSPHRYEAATAQIALTNRAMEAVRIATVWL